MRKYRSGAHEKSQHRTPGNRHRTPGNRVPEEEAEALGMEEPSAGQGRETGHFPGAKIHPPSPSGSSDSDRREVEQGKDQEWSEMRDDSQESGGHSPGLPGEVNS